MPSFNKMLGRMWHGKTDDLNDNGFAGGESSFAKKLPVWLRWPMLRSFNFILFHYTYIIGMAILGSIILYPGGDMSYTDALFFAAGATTQSGLNTIDINKLLLYQQITMVFLSSLCNPITINTFVVFLRLYWFEKRFQHVIREARTFRQNRTRSRTKSEEKHTPDLERGVRGREIKVLHADSSETKNENGITGLNPTVANANESKQRSDSVSGTPKTPNNESPTFKREIMFADEVSPKPRKLSNDDRIPVKQPQEQHIAFVENQRNPKDKTALRIPGPRDFERGHVPERVEHHDSDSPHALRRNSSHHSDLSSAVAHKPGEVTFEEQLRSSKSELNQDKTPLRNRFRRNSSPIRLGDRAKSFIGRTFTHNAEDNDPVPYLSYAATIGRNSTFVDLTEEQREELGGIEYRSLKTLATVLLIYNIGFTILPILTLTPWIVRSERYSAIVREDGQSPAWWGIFTAISMFTDLGFTLTPDSMISFQSAALPLIIGTFCIIIGNTGFPVMLRFIIWLASHIAPWGSGVWEELRFLLDHPRRCFTLLFPRRATWWLFGVLIVLNGIDLIFFVLLDLKDEAVTHLTPGFQFLNGLFQAASTRTAGFASVNLADLHPGIQVSYMIMMYISVFPIAISVRQTNVYEEKSLGIYESPTEAPPTGDTDDEQERSYMSSHLRRQLSFDLWYVFLGLFLICVIEGRRIQAVNEPAFTVFSILFEIVSAYGTVGLSLGFPNANTSFSGQFKVLSKLIIIAMMIRGRHRGLPYALDRAILLPGEGLKKDKQRRLEESRKLQHAATDETGLTRGRARSRSRVNLARIVTGGLSVGPSNKQKRG